MKKKKKKKETIDKKIKIKYLLKWKKKLFEKTEQYWIHRDGNERRKLFKNKKEKRIKIWKREKWK